MKEQDLIDLGFEKEYDDDFFYYRYEFTDDFILITNGSDEIIDNQWVIEIFFTEGIRFTDKKDVKQLINIIKRNTHARKIK
jgi:hypothetical protein